MLIEQYIRALETISRLTPLIRAEIYPSGQRLDGTRSVPTGGSRPPCNVTWIDVQERVRELLGLAVGAIREHTAGLHGRPVPTIDGMCQWIAAQYNALESLTCLDSPTWWCDGDGRSVMEATVWIAQALEVALDPPVKHPPAGNARQMCIATGVPVETIKTWGKRGRIPRFKAPGGYLYRRRDIESLL